MILISPRTTEKAYGLSAGMNTYVFDVPVNANKQQILKAVEAEYGVKVSGIRTVVQSGKAIRFSRGKDRYPGTANRRNSKKAYVTLVDGDSIAVFDVPSEEEAK